MKRALIVSLFTVLLIAPFLGLAQEADVDNGLQGGSDVYVIWPKIYAGGRYFRPKAGFEIPIIVPTQSGKSFLDGSFSFLAGLDELILTSRFGAIKFPGFIGLGISVGYGNNPVPPAMFFEGGLELGFSTIGFSARVPPDSYLALFVELNFRFLYELVEAWTQ